MDNIQVDKIITEARGKCWHIKTYEWHDPSPDGYTFTRCVECGTAELKLPSPTTSWADYGEAIEWAKKEELWEDFIQYFLIRKFGSNIYDFSKSIINCMTDPEKGSHALAEFIEEQNGI